MIAEDLGVSNGRIASFDKVEKNAVPVLKAALQENRISVAAAASATELPPEMQEQLVMETSGTIDMKAIEEYQRKSAVEEKVEISQALLQKDLQNIEKCLEGIQAGALTSKEYTKYQKAIQIIINTFQRLSGEEEN